MKTRRTSGGLHFTEEELAQMQTRVRGFKVTAAGGGVEAAIAKKIHEENKRTTVFKPAAEKPVKKTTPRKIKEPTPVNQDADPDWTAPRTAKVQRVKGGKSVNEHITQVNASIRQAKILTSVSDNHLAISFEGARLLTLNEILGLLPYQPYLIYNYKTTWKNKIDEALLVAQDQHGKLPSFNDACIFVGIRRSTRLMDRDGLSSCFKYILDDLRNQQSINYPILKDDNANLIVDTPCFQSVGDFLVGFRLEKVEGWKEPTILSENILDMNPLAQKLWHGRKE
jgi:hypothetical protein